MGPCSSQTQKRSNRAPEQFNQGTTGAEEFKVGPDIFITLKQGSISNHYKIEKSLGTGKYSLYEGAFGEVRLVIHKSSGCKRAMKQIRKDKIIKEDEENMFSEVNTLKQLDHPNIVKLHELFQDQKNYYLVTEYECTYQGTSRVESCFKKSPI